MLWKNTFTWALVASCLIASAVPAEEGSIARIRDSLSSGDSSSGSSSHSGSSIAFDDDVDFSDVFLTIFACPIVIPKWALNDSGYEACKFSHYPYELRDGYLSQFGLKNLSSADHANLKEMLQDGLIDPHSAMAQKQANREAEVIQVVGEDGSDPLPSLRVADSEEELCSRNFSARVSGGWGSLSGLSRVDSRFLIENSNRWGFEANATTYFERLTFDAQDHTTIADFDLTYRFAQGAKGMLRAGPGLRIITDDEITKFGFNFTYEWDYFPKNPWVISTVMNMGNLREAFYFSARADVGFAFKHMELRGGWEYLHINDVNLDGPTIGLRIWF